MTQNHLKPKPRSPIWFFTLALGRRVSVDNLPVPWGYQWVLTALHSGYLSAPLPMAWGLHFSPSLSAQTWPELHGSCNSLQHADSLSPALWPHQFLTCWLDSITGPSLHLGLLPELAPGTQLYCSVYVLWDCSPLVKSTVVLGFNWVPSLSWL